MDMHSHQRKQGRGHSVGRWVFWGFVLVAGYFLYTEHRAHVISLLPFALLAACPLMHLFHHHGGNRHGGTDDGAQDASPERPVEPGAQTHPQQPPTKT